MKALILAIFISSTLPVKAVELRPPIAEASVPLPAPPMPSDPPQPTVLLPKAKTTEGVQVVVKTEKKHGLLVKTLLVPVDGAKRSAHFVGHKTSEGVIWFGKHVEAYQPAMNFLSSIGGAVSGVALLTGVLNGGKL